MRRLFQGQVFGKLFSRIPVTLVVSGFEWRFSHLKDNTKETDARIVVDDLLRQAHWDPADKSQVLTEQSVSKGGYADYVLLSQSGKPLAVIEAKRRKIEPYHAKQQTLPYAKQLDAPFIFLTNGEVIYFWDYTNDDARIINSFYSRRDMERLVYMRRERKPLATIEIPEYYIRQGEQRQVRPYWRKSPKRGPGKAPKWGPPGL